MADFYHRHKAKGLCPNCGAPASSDRVLCDDCTPVHYARVKALQDRLREERQCIDCFQAGAEPGRLRCEDCLEKQRQYIRLKRLQAREECAA